MIQVLVVDNDDSFVDNLVKHLGADCVVLCNDEPGPRTSRRTTGYRSLRVPRRASSWGCATGMTLSRGLIDPESALTQGGRTLLASWLAAGGDPSPAIAPRPS